MNAKSPNPTDRENIDELIHEALASEDDALLRDFNHEPGYFNQAFAMFSGRLGWVMWLVGIVQLLFGLTAIYALVQAFSIDQTLTALRWGLVAVVLVQLTVFLRGFMGSHFEANRVLREVKRLELRMIQQANGQGRASDPRHADSASPAQAPRAQ